MPLPCHLWGNEVIESLPFKPNWKKLPEPAPITVWINNDRSAFWLWFGQMLDHIIKMSISKCAGIKPTLVLSRLQKVRLQGREIVNIIIVILQMSEIIAGSYRKPVI